MQMAWILDRKNRVLTDLTHAAKLSEGNGQNPISTAPLYGADD